MPRTYCRDQRGRFCRKPAPTLLSPEVLKTLGQGRKAIDMTLDHSWTVEIHKRWTTYSHENPDTTASGGPTQA
jgi:hypothetical protein